MPDIVYEIKWLEAEQLEGFNCDYCNGLISEFPCATLFKNGEDPHALCKECRVRSFIYPGDQEYFETLAYQAKNEHPRPGENFGGRKKNA